MYEELATLDHTGTWDLVPLLSHVVPITSSGYTKLRLSWMVPLSDVNLILLLEVFSRLKDEIMMRHLHCCSHDYCSYLDYSSCYFFMGYLLDGCQ